MWYEPHVMFGRYLKLDIVNVNFNFISLAVGRQKFENFGVFELQSEKKKPINISNHEFMIFMCFLQTKNSAVRVIDLTSYGVYVE